MNAEKFIELIRSHATFVHHHCPDGATISRDMRTAARLIDEQQDKIQRMQAIVHAQRSLILEYEDELETDTYPDDEVPDGIVDAVAAVRAAEKAREV